MTSDDPEDGASHAPDDTSASPEDDLVPSASPQDGLVRIERHLGSALDAVEDERGRYHVRQALQLVAAERERGDGSLLDVE
ncbi:hypothetical protein [Halorubrum sp. DTA98]|uniref:hypothetical protein n=1 Tax=Halorubrum sp. DTA98 TaxID=3402163 RepID=UPI003AABAA50